MYAKKAITIVVAFFVLKRVIPFIIEFKIILYILKLKLKRKPKFRATVYSQDKI